MVTDTFLAAIVTLLPVSWTYMQAWRFQRKYLASSIAECLCKDGIITMKSFVESNEKENIWKKIMKPHMITHWGSIYDRFDPDDIDSIPQPENGRRYEMASRDSSIPDLPKLTSQNYGMQIVICALFDSTFQLVHFGKQTHWKVKLIISPLWWLFGDSFEPPSMFELFGADQAWHLANAPNIHGVCGKCIPTNTHIDGGEKNVYVNEGLPPHHKFNALSSFTGDSLTVEEDLLMMVLHQVKS